MLGAMVRLLLPLIVRLAPQLLLAPVLPLFLQLGMPLLAHLRQTMRGRAESAMSVLKM